MSELLDRAVRDCDLLMVDFDGPVCDIFAGLPASDVAERMYEVTLEAGYPVQLADFRGDPVHALTLARGIGGEPLRTILAIELSRCETQAVKVAVPTTGIEDVLKAARDANCTLAIVSNNSVEAVETYLAMHGIRSYFSAVFARTDDLDPSHLKPHPFLVRQAVRSFRTALHPLLIGDSDTDVAAARAVGVDCVGYANKEGKRELFIAGGAVAVVEDMHSIAAAIRRAAT